MCFGLITSERFERANFINGLQFTVIIHGSQVGYWLWRHQWSLLFRNCYGSARDNDRLNVLEKFVIVMITLEGWKGWMNVAGINFKDNKMPWLHLMLIRNLRKVGTVWWNYRMSSKSGSLLNFLTKWTLRCERFESVQTTSVSASFHHLKCRQHLQNHSPWDVHQ